MKNKLVYLFEIILLVFIVIFKIIFLDNLVEYSMLANIVFWFIFTIAAYLCFGYVKDKSYFKKTATRIVVIILLLYFLITFLLGFVVGFTRNNIDSSIIGIIKTIVPYIILFTLMELSRYMIFKKKISKPAIVILVAEYIILNVIIGISDKNLSDLKYIFITTSTVILPIISNELLCSYMTYEISYKPSLIYKIVMDLYIYVLLILPTLGNYLLAMCGVIFPFIIFIEVRKNLHYHDKYIATARKRLSKALIIILMSFFLLIASLVSGIFKYELVAIMTNSMKPVYSRGDAVIINKKDAEEIKVGDVLAFNLGDGIVTHRVIRIVKSNNDYTFITKGDNNEQIDIYDIRKKHVIGTVDYVLKYSGYPTVLVTELFERS